MKNSTLGGIGIALLALIVWFLIRDLSTSQSEKFPNLYLTQFESFDTILGRDPIVIQGADGYAHSDHNQLNVSGSPIKINSIIELKSNRVFSMVSIYEVVGDSQINITCITPVEINYQIDDSKDYEMKVDIDKGFSKFSFIRK